MLNAVFVGFGKLRMGYNIPSGLYVSRSDSQSTRDHPFKTTTPSLWIYESLTDFLKGRVRVTK